MSEKAENLNQAIVNKVEKILNNADCLDSVYITIEANRGEAPIITYKIREFIVPDNAEDEIYKHTQSQGADHEHK